MPHRKQSGFTLVELAIVLMIIGLLIGGILKGQELIQNARITSVINQVRGYEAALITFRDSYNALQGDIASPSTRLPNCSASPCSTAGNANGNVDYVATTAGFGGPAHTDERSRFFRHLAVANLISGIDTATTSTDSWGQVYPATPLGGGFQLQQFAQTNPVNEFGTNLNGIFLFMKGGGSPVASTSGVYSNTTQGVVSPHVAATIDRKMDDGHPGQGNVLAFHDTNDGCIAPGPPGSGSSPVTYLEQNSNTNCNLLIRINN